MVTSRTGERLSFRQGYNIALMNSSTINGGLVFWKLLAGKNFYWCQGKARIKPEVVRGVCSLYPPKSAMKKGISLSLSASVSRNSLATVLST
jgi:hypothetical protein